MSQFYCSYYIFDQINAAFGERRDFKKQNFWLVLYTHDTYINKWCLFEVI